MGHGTPDWGVTKAETTIYGMHDMAELAARMESVDIYDRRGNVVFMDGFEHTMNKWQEDGKGTGHAAVVDNTHALGGEYSCKLTTGSDGLQMGIIAHQHAGLLPSKIGAEVSFTANPILNNFEVIIYLMDGTYYHEAAIAYDDLNQRVLYMDSDGNLAVHSNNIDLFSNVWLFNTLKFVIDMETGKYDYLILNNRPFDLSSLGYNHYLNSTWSRLMFQIITTSSTGTNQVCYIDNAILTQNEP